MIKRSRVKTALTVALTAVSTTTRAEEPPGFVQILPSDIKWIPSPVVPGTQRAVLFGNPDQSGPFVMRVKVPPGTRIMPHTHPEARTYTVLAGEWKLGFGEKYDAGKLRSFSAGSIYRLPANVPHFQATGQAETIVQIEAIGPSGHHYVNRLDDHLKK